jgi:hypothetical protein
MFDETQGEFNRTPVDTYKIFAEHNSILQHFATLSQRRPQWRLSCGTRAPVQQQAAASR